MVAQPRKSLADQVKANQSNKEEQSKNPSTEQVKENEVKENNDTSTRTRTHETPVGEDPTVSTDMSYNDSNVPVGVSDKKNDGMKDEIDDDSRINDKIKSENDHRISLAKDDPRNPPNKNTTNTSATAQARADKYAPTGPGANMYSGGSVVYEDAPEEATLINTPSEIALVNKKTQMEFAYAIPLHEVQEAEQQRIEEAQHSEDDRSNKDDE